MENSAPAAMIVLLNMFAFGSMISGNRCYLNVRAFAIAVVKVKSTSDLRSLLSRR